MRTRDIHDLGFSCFANIDIYIYRIIRFGETWEIRSWKKVSIFLVSSRKRSITGKRYHPILNDRTIVCQHLEFVRIGDRNEAKLEPLEILGIPMNSRVTRYFRESLIISENSRVLYRIHVIHSRVNYGFFKGNDFQRFSLARSNNGFFPV